MGQVAGTIDHQSTVRRSGFIGDKLYSIATNSVKAVAIDDPDVVIGTVADVLQTKPDSSARPGSLWPTFLPV